MRQLRKKEDVKLSASLICGDMIHLKKDIALLEKGKIDYFHIDIMDGVFVPRFGLFPEIITTLRSVSSIPIDLHMMVTDAEGYIKTFVHAGMDKQDDIFVFHAETTNHIDRVIRTIHSYGMKAGLAINPATSLSVLDYILDDIDVIEIMGINPGILGHKLIPSTMHKIADVKTKLKDHPHIEIEVDGGVTFESVLRMRDAGASMFVCGTQTIFSKDQPIDRKITQLRRVLEK